MPENLVHGPRSVKPCGYFERKGYDQSVKRGWRRGLCGLGLVGALAAAGSTGCAGDHDALAKQAPGASGAAGSAGTAGGGGQGGAPVEAGSDASIEPPGANALTLVHGVVDAETIAFCFARGDDELLGDPMPKGGLGYGHALALGAVPGIALDTDDFVPFVVAADAALLSASSCAALVSQSNLAPDAGADAGADAAPSDPAIRARALALIPSGTLSGGYSYLLVAAGCLGAPSHTDSALEQSVCGAGYAPTAPTLTPIAVQMSRITQPDRLGLQVLHASVASESVGVRSLPVEASLPAIQIASGVLPGAIAPRPPNLAHGSVSFGTPIGDSTLEIAGAEGTAFAVGFSWATAISLGGLASLKDGQTYALILLGPRPIVGQTSWWNPPAVTLVPSDPAL
jgi:hypothetical protein